MNIRYIDTEDNAAQFHYNEIKKGTFSKVYLSDTQALVVTPQDCYDKEILCNVKGRHIPKCWLQGYLKDESMVYLMPRYKKVVKGTQAYKDAREVRRIFKQAMMARLFIDNPFDGSKRLHEVLDRIEDKEGELWSNLDELLRYTTNYGSQYTTDQLRIVNLAMDDEGELILLDCVFDLEQMRRKVRERNEKHNRAAEKRNRAAEKRVYA